MKALNAELPKLKGSLSWLVAMGLPVLAVSSVAGRNETIDTWDLLWLRSIGFYGMILLPVGIAILASLVWRVEHHRGNWNFLIAQPVSSFDIVSAKAITIALLAAAMQVTLVISVCLVGKFGLGLTGFLPSHYWFRSVLVVFGCVPVAVVQSLLSMVLRSFAIPVAIALVGTGLSTVVLLTIGSPAVFSPYGLATYSTQMGTSLVNNASTVFQAAALTPASVGTLGTLSAGLTAVLLGAAARVLGRRDLHG